MGSDPSIFTARVSAVVVRMGEGVAGLRAKAEHYRRLANLLTDEQAVRQLLELATRFETEANRLEADEKDEAQKPTS